MGLFPYYSEKETNQWNNNRLLEEEALRSKGYSFKKGVTWTKDGDDIQFYVALSKENIRTTEIQRQFLLDRGYVQYSIIEGNYHDDYDNNYKKEKRYFEEHGFVPRWKKGDELFDWESALTRENFSFNRDVLKLME